MLSEKDLSIKKDIVKKTNFKLGKYGGTRARYLKEHKKAEYSILLIDGKLDEYLYLPKHGSFQIINENSHVFNFFQWFIIHF